jgi:hypothetical protein
MDTGSYLNPNADNLQQIWMQRSTHASAEDLTMQAMLRPANSKPVRYCVK